MGSNKRMVGGECRGSTSQGTARSHERPSEYGSGCRQFDATRGSVIERSPNDVIPSNSISHTHTIQVNTSSSHGVKLLNCRPYPVVCTRTKQTADRVLQVQLPGARTEHSRSE
ncbi:GD22038 [Drosophila simulans]|uniref:GD22038 n=1 Tax=Drosophila simulans TaxID=7240 RepID=B4NV48_DROSI|nr:GD22038 [Drosophila simulans]